MNAAQTPVVLHVVQRLTGGGAARSMMTEARLSHATGLYQHRIASLLPADPGQARRLAADGIAVLDAPTEADLRRTIEAADLVVVQFWNTPELYSWLRTELPPARLLLRPQIGGLDPPQVITAALLDVADMTLLPSPACSSLSVVTRLPAPRRARDMDILPSVADFGRLAGLERPPHPGFNIGYIGTLSPIKMHPRFLEMSAAIRIPDARFVLAGRPVDFKPLRRRAERLGLAHRLDFRGYVNDIAALLSELDVFGYPLAPGNYSAADLALQEAMAAGVPPVIFPHGATSALVAHDRTGLIVHTEQEYVAAIEYLYQHPAERRRLGEAAAAYTRQALGPAQALATLHRVYAALLTRPRRSRRLTDVPPDASGAALFVASLGESAPHFGVSLQSADRAAVLAADQAIGASPPMVCAEGGGGLFHYRAVYPRDSVLRLWAGLVWLGQGQNARALMEFRAAMDTGGHDWRASWYRAQAADRLGAQSLALSSLRDALTHAPDFTPARVLLDQWSKEQPR